ncbi:MAG: phosphate ABC transporter permease PstA [Oscillospiraceae bacterium]|nr:phosphate ABC transporter permease PstA [Oscillospiraceae bacterium]
MKRKTQSIFLRTITYASITVTLVSLVGIIGYIFTKGIPYLSPELFAFEYNSENVSLYPALINTVSMTLLTLIIVVPLGVAAAIYLVEYEKKGSKLAETVRIMAETLAGIPSIVYGLFGYLMFVIYIGWGKSFLAGSLTLGIMILPVIMRTTEESLKSVPDTFREGSFGLGAGKLRTVFKIVIPYAVPGIFAGIVLSVGRIVGETAALIYTSGTVAHIPDNLMSSGRTLSVHLYSLWKEGFNTNQAYATAVVLMIIVVGINALSSFIAKKIGKG